MTIAGLWRLVTCGCCPDSERLAKQLSKKNFRFIGINWKAQWENFCLANRLLTGHGRGHALHHSSIVNSCS